MINICPECEEGYFKDGVCSKCFFSIVDPLSPKCPLCGGTIEIKGPFSGLYYPKCMDYDCLPEIPEVKKIYRNTPKETLEAWIELCKKIMIHIGVNSVFGFSSTNHYIFGGVLRKPQLVLYVSDKKVWEEKKCCSDYTNNPEYEVLSNLGFHEDCDATFIQTYDRKQIKIEDKEQLKEKLIKAGFEYSKEFEEFMRDGEEE